LTINHKCNFFVIYLKEMKFHLKTLIYSKNSGRLTSTLNGNESDTFVNVPTFSQPNLCPNHPGPNIAFALKKKTINAASMYVNMFTPSIFQYCADIKVHIRYVSTISLQIMEKARNRR